MRIFSRCREIAGTTRNLYRLYFQPTINNFLITGGFGEEIGQEF
jgi:hypothetical protein